MIGPFISEDKIIFGVYAHAMSQMTIAKMRKIYNKVDSKSIAKQVWCRPYLYNETLYSQTQLNLQNLQIVTQLIN